MLITIVFLSNISYSYTYLVVLLQQAKVNIVLTLLHGALFGDESQLHDMSIIANRVYDILTAAKTVEKGKEQKHRRKKRHKQTTGTTSTPAIAMATPSTTAIAHAKTKLQGKGKQQAKAKPPSKKLKK